MDSVSSVSPTIVLPPPSDPLRPRRLVVCSLTTASTHKNHRIPRLFLSSRRRRRRVVEVSCNWRSSGRFSQQEENSDGDDEEEKEREEVERALHMDGTIPGTSNEFVKQVSSRAYDMRRHLHQTFDSSSYDVLDANPWRETSKPVYVLTHRENQLCTMKTRRNRSEVERELGLLFSKGGKWRSGIGNQAKQTRTGTKFQMLVEDIREGVLFNYKSTTTEIKETWDYQNGQ
nr:hypothetical protein CFP56_02108 [Quercus suber]